MGVNATSGVMSDIMNQFGPKESANTNNNMDKDAFLNLLVTQLKYQNPLEPTANEDFLAQMAQFSALEQMQNLNKSSNVAQANQLIGKAVSGIVKNEISGVSKEITGIVSSVSIKNGEVFLKVGEHDMELSKITKVEATASDSSLVAIEGFGVLKNKLTDIEKLLQESLLEKVVTNGNSGNSGNGSETP